MAAVVEVTPRQIFATHGRTLTIHLAEGENKNAAFDQICTEFENTRIEQDRRGDIRIMAPTGGESSYRNMKIATQLDQWAEKTAREWHSVRSRCLSCRMRSGRA